MSQPNITKLLVELFALSGTHGSAGINFFPVSVIDVIFNDLDDISKRKIAAQLDTYIVPFRKPVDPEEVEQIIEDLKETV